MPLGSDLAVDASPARAWRASVEVPDLPLPRLKYRADIDGLRAVAVLAVFAYHLGVIALKGGFVGVDIFFVISGYLIGSIIIANRHEGFGFIAHFYSRRIRRILPALIVMILVCFGAGYSLLFPEQLKQLGWSSIFAALSSSNIYFLSSLDYFAAQSSAQPLLHTWSLGVEEQFYLVFPLALIACAGLSLRRLRFYLVLVAAASLLYSAGDVFFHPAATFYLATTRAWELLLGTLVALQGWMWRLPKISRNILALAGLLMLALSILLMRDDLPFPGLAALPPCVGAALVIGSGQSGQTWVSRFLSLKPVVFVGLISYSLYLWHWPVIVLHDMYPAIIPAHSVFVTRLVIVGIAMSLATVSWRFVELPFRRINAVQNDGPTIACGVFGSCVVVAIGLFTVAGNGFPGRFPPIALPYMKASDPDLSYFRQGRCFIEPPSGFADFDQSFCLHQDAGRPNYLLLGDSHAGQLWYGLATVLRGVNVEQLTAAACPPLLQPRWIVSQACRKLMELAFNNTLKKQRIDRLLIAARWIDSDVPKLEDVLRWVAARGIPVTVFDPMVEYDTPLPRLLVDAAGNASPPHFERHVVDHSVLEAKIEQLCAKYHVQFVSFSKLICPDGHCVVVSPDREPLEFDTNHLSKQGSLFVAQKLVDDGSFPCRRQRSQSRSGPTSARR